MEILIPQRLIVFNSGDPVTKYDCREDESAMQIV